MSTVVDEFEEGQYDPTWLAGVREAYFTPQHYAAQIARYLELSDASSAACPRWDERVIASFVVPELVPQGLRNKNLSSEWCPAAKRTLLAEAERITFTLFYVEREIKILRDLLVFFQSFRPGRVARTLNWLTKDIEHLEVVRHTYRTEIDSALRNSSHPEAETLRDLLLDIDAFPRYFDGRQHSLVQREPTNHDFISPLLEQKLPSINRDRIRDLIGTQFFLRLGYRTAFFQNPVRYLSTSTPSPPSTSVYSPPSPGFEPTSPSTSIEISSGDESPVFPTPLSPASPPQSPIEISSGDEGFGPLSPGSSAKRQRTIQALTSDSRMSDKFSQIHAKLIRGQSPTSRTGQLIQAFIGTPRSHTKKYSSLSSMIATKLSIRPDKIGDFNSLMSQLHKDFN